MDESGYRKSQQYFWTGWLVDLPFRDLAGVFVLLSLADLAASLQLLRSGDIREGNELALTVLMLFGIRGLAVYKVFLVAVILVLCWLIDRKNHPLAQIVMWGAILLMGYIALRHLGAIAMALM
ncbi:MAG: DUF5658 family protein [Armatimonadota bacterium]